MLARLFERFVAGVLRWPLAAVAFAISVIGAGALSATRIQLADDARALIADADPAVARQIDALTKFTAADTLLLHVTTAEQADLDGAAARLAEALHATHAFSSIRYQVEPDRALRLADALMPQRFVLDGRDPETLFGQERLAERLREVRVALLAPDALITKPLLLRDPMGSVGSALQALSGAPGLPKLDASSGTYRSMDGTAILMVLTPHGNPFSGNDAAHTMAAVHTASERVPGATVRAIGAHRFSHDAEQLIRGDVNFSVVTSLLGVLVIFVLFFRRPALAFVAVPSMVFGAAVGCVLAACINAPIHPIVLAFAAACLGLSIDTTVHLVSTVAGCGGNVRAALPRAAAKIGPSLWLVMSTTAVGLLALVAARTPALRQMGVLSIGAVVGAFIGALVFVPLILPLVARQAPVPPLLHGPWSWAVVVARRHSSWVLGIALGVALVALWMARAVSLDGDLRNLDTHSGATLADERVFADAFGDPGTSGLVVIEAPDVGDALTRADAAAQRLRHAGLSHVLTPSALAPPPAVAAARRARWCASDGRYAERLTEVGEGVGFASSAFSVFAHDLSAFCADGPPSPEPALAALEGILERRILERDGGVVRTIVAFDATPAQLATAQRLVGLIEGAEVVHRAGLNERLVKVVAADLPRLAALAFGLVLLILIATFRNLSHTLQALAPCVLAGVTTLAVLAALDVPINLMNLCVFPLLAGIGIDYGVLMADADRTADVEAPAERAFSLTVSAITTIADFGTLAVADYYALATIGRTVLIAVGAAALYALFLPQALATWRRRRGSALAASSQVSGRAVS